MRNTQRRFAAGVFATVVLALVVMVRAGAVTTPQEDPGAGYAWAESCKTCHAEIYEAWSRSKHARAIDRLSASDQKADCLGCHVTGGNVRIEKDGKFVNANVQCESCHGKAAAHVADPAVRVGLTRKPQPPTCEVCHSAKSPKFRGFYYGALVGLVHPVKK
jgi:hypothetical protein